MTKKWYEELSREEHNKAIGKGLKTTAVLCIPMAITGPTRTNTTLATLLGTNAYDAEKKRLQTLREERINRAALTIQLHGQDYVRRREEKERQEWRQKNAAAPTIQKHVRGHLARNKYEENLNTIYKNVRGRIGNRDVFERLKEKSQDSQIISR